MSTNQASIRYDLAVDLRPANGETLRCRSVEVGADYIMIKSPYTAAQGTRFRARFSLLIAGKPHEIDTLCHMASSYLVGGENLFRLQLRYDQLTPSQKKDLEAFIRERKHA